ncbi:MAG TPA: serine hydrolase domain-containing protein [Gammaproteobacteria bacterium]|nr:serine hydrolase domain-containing protein [Gammaproteobacteria bacterium]
MQKNKILKFIAVIGITVVFFTSVFANDDNRDIDHDLIIAMKTYRVPVAGYAIIKNYKIIAVKTLSIDSKIQVSDKSLFQAASISKSISAYGALKLVSRGKLNLDAPVNNQLITWKIPDNKYSKNNPVTLKQLLDMTSGLSVSGFPGHAQGEKLPTLEEILDGKPPANTPPIRIFYKPGAQYFYSGGAFEVLEKLMEDSTKQAFEDWMNNEIFKPLNMDNSIYQYPLKKELFSVAVPGFLSDGTMIKGGWNNYAIAGAGGAWSTPGDIARFAINVSNAYLGKENNLISKSVAKQMLTRQKNTDYGLGVVLNGNGRTLNFRKAGHNNGYHNEMIMFPNSGDGVVVMTNSENGEYIINYIIPLIAQKYHWPCYFPYFDELMVIPVRAC